MAKRTRKSNLPEGKPKRKMAVLEEILAVTRAGLPGLHQRTPALERAASDRPIPASFKDALRRERVALIAEVKRRSPSVRGQSMIDEQIADGDLVVVNGRESADNGEMVIALVHGNEATVKRFYREPGGWIRLQPSNTTMRPLRYQESDVLIQGVVVGVIRKF